MIIIISIVLLTLSILQTVTCARHSLIGACYYYDDVYPKSNLTLVCIDDNWDISVEYNLFNPPTKSICLNQDSNPGYTDGFLQTWIGEVKFQDCDISKIPPQFFEIYKNVYKFNISDVGLTSVEVNDFEYANNLLELDLSHNKIRELPTDLLEIGENITKADFSFNQLSRFNYDAFPTKSQLNYLNLCGNNVTELTVQSLQKFTELEQVLLCRNQIREIPSFLFHKTEKLIEVDLSMNKIGKIDDFAFAGDFNLEKLNLSHNELGHFDKQFLENFSNLKLFDISSNKIQQIANDTFINTPNIVSLNLSNNLLQKVNNKTFTNLVKLEHVNLSRNNLSQVEPGTFATLTTLQSLDLSHNELVSLDANILSSPPSQLRLLVIANNRLRELNGFTLATIPNGKIIGVDSNKFSCSYLKNTLFQSITWKHLDAISSRIECNSNNEATELSDEVEVTTLKKESQTRNHSQQFSSTEFSTVEYMPRQKLEDQGNSSAHLLVVTYLSISISVVCLVVVIGFSWLFFCKKLPSENIYSEVIYRKNDNVVENQCYDYSKK